MAVYELAAINKMQYISIAGPVTAGKVRGIAIYELYYK
jgi:hypothetical protein